MGDWELCVGVRDDVPEFPVFPELEVSEVPPDEELPLLDVDEVDPDPAVVGAELAPGRSWATTTPRATVAPAAATTAPRVRVRKRVFALSLSAGVFVSTRPDMWLTFLGRGRPYPNMLESTPAQGRLWCCCDIVPQLPGG